jgi:hypothetical protein
MSEKPTFDPARSGAIKQMLIGEVDRTEATAPWPARRVALVISLILAAVLLAGGGTAFALGLRPFSAPAPTPTQSTPTIQPTSSATRPPTSTPTPVADSGIPGSTIPLDCATLGKAPSFGGLVPNADLSRNPQLFTPQDAGLRQAGVLECQWFGGSRSYLIADIASDPEAGRADVSKTLNNGGTSLDVGDDSAVSCVGGADICDVSIVVGPYWLAFESTVSQPIDGGIDPAISQVAQQMASELGALPAPLSQWAAPPTSWSSADECSALSTATPMSSILNSPGITGPGPVNPGTENGIVQSQPNLYRCRWGVPDGETTSDGQIRNLSVELAPGTEWAFDHRPEEGTPVVVSGAEEARFTCTSVEVDAPQCWLDVLADHSWMQLGRGDMIYETQKSALVAAAEAILAAHHSQ